ncbi:hypothetical protein Lalb_Chr01g0017211 [Lupinus albus]|uniref:Uncharacterized protein n=1 Tax=Lupinus albus TaxID=3870 RepID=A0A6A4R6M3_LUPAL|nr:hypothetical protein Lalb_Chr01g0017211 [Lupinus albus]
MSQWRKQQDQSLHQMGHWRSSSYNKKPPFDNCHSTVPSWEKKFCSSVGAVPWRKLLESQKYMYLHENVAEINGLPCNILLPDPNIYVDDVDWNSCVDPELILDLERDRTVLGDEARDQEVVILDSYLLMDQSFSCTGWGDAEAATPKPNDMNQSFTPTALGHAEAATPKPYDLNQSFPPSGWGDAEDKKQKPSDPVSATQCWEPNLHENNRVDSWEQYRAADKQNCQHDSRGWNQRNHYGGDRSWGTWSKTPAYHGNEYQMNRGKWNNRGRVRGNFAYHIPYVDKVPTATPW